jgi:hypothetical protein
MKPMIAKEEADGLLAEAAEAEKTGKFVQLTPEYTRHIVALLTEGKPEPRVEWCDVCPHAMHLHNPDGSCPCGINCAERRGQR